MFSEEEEGELVQFASFMELKYLIFFIKTFKNKQINNY